MVSNYLNKIFYLLVLFFIVLVINILTTSNANAACEKNASGAIIVDTGDSTPFKGLGASGFDEDACQEEPDEYKLTFYKVYLCEEAEDPYTNGASPDYTGCVNIFDEEREIIIKPGEDTD